MQIFISHSSHDAETAMNVCRVLEKNGHTCFIAPRNIRPGREYAEEIVNGINGADILLLLLSKEANQSPHVLREVERAGSSRIRIVVYRLEEVELTKSMEYFLMTNQWIDGENDMECKKILEALDSLPNEIRKHIPVAGYGGQRGNRAKKVLSLLFLLLAVACVGVFVGIAVGRNQKQEPSVAVVRDDLTLEPGDTVEFGTYAGMPVVWRVLRKSDDGEQLILLSDKILTMKAFDVAESGTYNSDGSKDYWETAVVDAELEAYVRGSNLWADSNIRTWLNSEKESVSYEGQAPCAEAMSELKNGYSNEPGFLNGFAPEERAVLREMTIETEGNVPTEDKVFLLSREELSWLREADLRVYAEPTQEAVKQDQTGWYESYSLSLGVEDYIWLLRDPVEESGSKCYAVGNGYRAKDDGYEQIMAGTEGFGIRPAVCVDLQALIELLSKREEK